MNEIERKMHRQMVKLLFIMSLVAIALMMFGAKLC
jgi:hypothetical protein